MAIEQIRREQYRHWVSIEVRWGDMDSFGHVNNAVYFTYCESGRISLFSQIGITRPRRAASEPGPALVSATCDFKQQVAYPAVLDVGVRIGEIGRRSFHMDYAIFRHQTDEVVALGSSVVAWVDYTAGRAIQIPDALRVELAKFQAV